MKIGIVRAAFLASAAGLSLMAVSLAFAQKEHSSDESLYAELAKVPAKARARHNPFEGNLDAVASGRKLFQNHCGECHGNNAEGTRRGPSLRAQEVQQATPGALFWTMTNGVVRRGMPVWSKLPEQQRWQIVTYIKSLEAETGVTAHRPQ